MSKPKPDTIEIPLTPLGAIKLGRNPCSVCEMGWARWTYNEENEKSEHKSCHETCELLKRWIEEELK